MKTILVVGATGKTGREVVTLLVRRGEHVRSATRSPASAPCWLCDTTEVAEFDFERPETFSGAVAGVDRIFLMARPGDNHSDLVAIPLVDAAKKSGVRRIVNLTAMGVEQDESFMLRKLERYVEDSGISFTHVRPNWFMQNFNSGPMLADIRATGALHLPAADATLSFIDVRDIAEVSVAALTDPRHDGRAYTLTGGEALTHQQVMEKISRAAGRTLSYVPLSEEAACARLAGLGVEEGLIERWREFYRKIRAGACSPISPDVEQVLGHAPRTFDRYVIDYTESWRG